MRTCPYCQFLVSDGAEQCSVCHRDLTATAVPVGAAQGAFAAPGQATAPGGLPQAPSFGGAPLPPPPGMVIPPGAAPPPSGRGTPWLRLVLLFGALGMVGLLAVAALFLVGTTVDPTSTIQPDELSWERYDDADGRFTVDLPGSPQVDTLEVPDGMGGTADGETISVGAVNYQASIGILPDGIPDGMTFDEIPFSPTGAERGAAANGLSDAALVSHGVVEGTGATEMDLELRGTVDGDDGVLLSRLVLVGPDIYEISVAGPVGQRDTLLDMQERIVSSFSTTTGA